jgi:hypothetical protein
MTGRTWADGRSRQGRRCRGRWCPTSHRPRTYCVQRSGPRCHRSKSKSIVRLGALSPESIRSSVKYQKCLTTAGRATVPLRLRRRGVWRSPGRRSRATSSSIRSPGTTAVPALLAEPGDAPWKTLAHALSLVQGAPRRRLARRLRRIRADLLSRGRPAPALPGARGSSPPWGFRVQVNHPSVVVARFHLRGGAHGLRASAANGLIVRNCVTVWAQPRTAS